MVSEPHHCPRCGSQEVETWLEPSDTRRRNHLRCRACGAVTELDTKPFTSPDYPEPHLATPEITDLPEGEPTRFTPL